MLDHSFATTNGHHLGGSDKELFPLFGGMLVARKLIEVIGNPPIAKMVSILHAFLAELNGKSPVKYRDILDALSMALRKKNWSANKVWKDQLPAKELLP
jgi:hypothetical protein